MKSEIVYFYLLLLTFLFVAEPVKSQEEANNPRWDKYHSTKEAYALIESWAKTYPNLAKVFTIGKTLKGTPLKVLEITNNKTGLAESKPAYYYDGNIHAGELTGAEVSLHYAWYLLSNYDSDVRIQHLVDTRALYIRPKFNPDGADLALQTATVLRSTPRPYDNDFDGLLDEDPSNDLDANGIITKMRVKSVDGKFKISEKDPRVMVEREATETGGIYYDVYTEGIDDDGDGRFNEDGVGGIDMNRNFPRNWGLEFEQRGAGPYPLSEPETRATIEFLNSHRNITGVFHGHTSGGILFRLPSTTNWDNYNMFDQRLILELSKMYTTTTDQRVIPSYSNPRLHRHGTLISWAYWDFGVVAYVPEFWGGFVEDYDGDGDISDFDDLTWNDKVLGGKGFVNWTSVDHPQFGNVEVGGWDRKFTFQNPPPKLLKGEIEKYVEWMLWLAETSPELKINTVELTAIEKNKVVRLDAQVQNIGYLATNITQRAIDAKLIQPVRASLTLENAELISGQLTTDLGHLEGLRNSNDAASESKRNLSYSIKINGKGASAVLTIHSEKGGTVSQKIPLN